MHGSFQPASTEAKAASWPILATLCLAVLIAQIDTAVVNLAIHPIGQYFAADVGPLQWVVDSYNLLYAVLLLTGLLADLYGRRLVFVAGAAIFTIASLICAAAPSIAILIAGRALAGVGAALLLPASLAIIRVLWRDPAARGRALGVWAGCNGVAFVIGPLVGGLLVSAFGWRSIFLVVVPLGAAAVALALALIPESADREDRRFDGVAQALGALALGAFAFAAIESQTTPFAALAALVISVVAFVVFLRTEAKVGAQALMPLDLFGSRAFRGAMTATAGMTFGMYGAIFLTPLTWQSEGLFSAIGAGLGLAPMALIYVALSPFSGALTEKFGARAMTSGGVAVIGCGLLTIALSAHPAPIVGPGFGLFLTGIGMGLATGPLNAVAVGSVAPARSGTASALINVARMMGATLGVAVLGAIFKFAQGGTLGLAVATLVGGLVQVSCAAYSWRVTRLRA